MAFLIDGFNLIYKFPEFEGMMHQGRLYDARIGLLNALKEYNNITKTKIRVVFDGRKDHSIDIRQENIKSIDVYYSLDYSADFLIKQFIKKDINPRMTTVVTSDKDIIDYVVRFKAKVKTSEEFYTHVNDTIDNHNESLKPEKDENLFLSEEEVLFWEKQFNNR